MIVCKTLFPILLLLLSSVTVQAQLLDPVSFHISDSPETVEAGEIFSVSITATIDGEWHLYSAKNDPDAGPYPTTFSTIDEHLYLAGDISETEPNIVLDPNFNEMLGWHANRATFTLPVAFDTLRTGRQAIRFSVLYQVCDDRSCLPPKTKEVESHVQVAGISDSPFQPTSRSSSNLILTIYSYPATVLPVLDGFEWAFWALLFFISAAGLTRNFWKP